MHIPELLFCEFFLVEAHRISIKVLLHITNLFCCYCFTSCSLPATKRQLKNALYPETNPNPIMADFRFKGYVNDFMVSPRNPITQNMAGKLVQPTTLYCMLFVVATTEQWKNKYTKYISLTFADKLITIWIRYQQLPTQIIVIEC